MKRSSRAWLLIPIVIAVVVVVGLLVSNYQKEVGIARPNNGGRAAVAAASVALELSSGTGVSDYTAFSDALLTAKVAQRNMPLMNPADTRLEHRLAEALDCLSAAREAWQTEIDQTWSPETHGVATFWVAMHPSVRIAGGALTAAGIRETSTTQAREVIEKAAELAD
jgi:hypothetical protein